LAVNRRWLDPFGIPRGQYSAWSPFIRGFVGGQIDASTNLTHLGAREYDPSLGRFISVDPLADITNPQQLNAYSYASNNPVTASDPSGMMEKIESTYGGNSAPNRNNPPPPEEPDPPKKTSFLDRYQSFRNRNHKAVGDAERWLGRGAVGKARDFSVYVTEHGDRWASDFVVDQVKDYGHEFMANCAGPRTYNAAGCELTVASAAAWFIPGLGPEAGVATKTTISILERLAAKRAAEEAAEALAARLTAREAAEKAAETAARICRNGNSFLPGTSVLMADGTSRPIEKIKLGDEVLATDPVTGVTSSQAVVATIIGQGEKNLVSLTVAAKNASGLTQVATLTATDGHLLYRLGSDWGVEAKDLGAGDKLRVAGTRSAYITTSRHYAALVRVYNLTVSGPHTYYVMAGSVPVLVHNEGGDDPDLGGLKKLSDSQAKKMLGDVHEFKQDVVGRGAKISSYDVYIEKSTGNLYLMDKSGRSVIPTYENKGGTWHPGVSGGPHGC
jgi:RHS repeat-associated protein